MTLRRLWRCCQCGKASVWRKGWSYHEGMSDDGITCGKRCLARMYKRWPGQSAPFPWSDAANGMLGVSMLVAWALGRRA